MPNYKLVVCYDGSRYCNKCYLNYCDYCSAYFSGIK